MSLFIGVCRGRAREVLKSALLVTDPELARYIKLHAIMTDHSPLHVEMFEDREAAADWLGVPNCCLEME
jgi:hypothetical protein